LAWVRDTEPNEYIGLSGGESCSEREQPADQLTSSEADRLRRRRRLREEGLAGEDKPRGPVERALHLLAAVEHIAANNPATTDPTASIRAAVRDRHLSRSTSNALAPGFTWSTRCAGRMLTSMGESIIDLAFASDNGMG